jgi:hypothetical protein
MNFSGLFCVASLASVLFLAGCAGYPSPAAQQGMLRQDSVEWSVARPGKNLLRSGDLVFREGRGIISRMVVQLSLQDPRYSHAGILEVTGDTTYVYHALGGEGRRTPLRKETLEAFCGPEGARAFGVYRLDLNPAQEQRFVSAAVQAYRSKIPFDTEYDLQSDTAYYCTEFVYRMVMRATGDEKYIPLTRLAGRTYVSCDNLYRNRHAEFIYGHVYPE